MLYTTKNGQVAYSVHVTFHPLARVLIQQRAMAGHRAGEITCRVQQNRGERKHLLL